MLRVVIPEFGQVLCVAILHVRAQNEHAEVIH